MLGMSYEQFLNMPFNFLMYAINGYNKEKELLYQQQWEMTRWLGFATHCAPRKKQIKPTDFIKFPWEIDEEKERTKSMIEILRAEDPKWG